MPAGSPAGFVFIRPYLIFLYFFASLYLQLPLALTFRQCYTQLCKQHLQFFAAGIGKRNAPAVFVATHLSLAAKALAQVDLQGFELCAFLARGFGARLRFSILFFPGQGIVPAPVCCGVFGFAHGKLVADYALA